MEIRSCHCVYDEVVPEKEGMTEIVYYQSLRELLNLEILRVYYGELNDTIFPWLGEDAVSIVQAAICRFRESVNGGPLSLVWYLLSQDLTGLYTMACNKLGAYIGRRNRIFTEELADGEVCAIKEVHNFLGEDGRYNSYCSTNCSVGYLFQCTKFANGSIIEFPRAKTFDKALQMFVSADFYTYPEMRNVVATIASVLKEDEEVMRNCIEFVFINYFLQVRREVCKGETYGRFVHRIGGVLNERKCSA